MEVSKEHMQHIAEQYLLGLNQGDSSLILNLFSDQAVVVSPIYGRRKAREFFTTLFDDTKSSETRLVELICDPSKQVMVLVFAYNWVLKDGREIDFEVADVMHLNEKRLIEKLTIYYDTFPLRGTK